MIFTSRVFLWLWLVDCDLQEGCYSPLFEKPTFSLLPAITGASSKSRVGWDKPGEGEGLWKTSAEPYRKGEVEGNTNTAWWCCVAYSYSPGLEIGEIIPEAQGFGLFHSYQGLMDCSGHSLTPGSRKLPLGWACMSPLVVGWGACRSRAKGADQRSHLRCVY